MLERDMSAAATLLANIKQAPLIGRSTALYFESGEC